MEPEEYPLTMARRVSHVRRRRRFTRSATAAVIVVLAALFTPAPAAAAFPHGVAFDATVNGDFVIVGNGVLECAAVGTTICNNLHNGTGGIHNNITNMVHAAGSAVLAEEGAENSSTALLDVPAGASVAYAQLSWMGTSGRSAGATPTNSTGIYCTVPEGTPADRSVMLQPGAGAPISRVSPDMIDGGTPPASGASSVYVANADVTALFGGLITGSGQEISVGDLWAGTGRSCFAGWSLTVVYSYPEFIPGTAASTAHRVVVYRGSQNVSPGGSRAFSLDGFTAAGAGGRVGYFLAEGDAADTGDFGSYTTTSSTMPTRIPNGQGGTNNIAMSRTPSGLPFPDYAASTSFTNASVDVATASLDGVAPGDTSLNFLFGSAGDGYVVMDVALSIPVSAIKVVVTPTQVRTPDEPAVFDITVSNPGSVPLSGMTVSPSAAFASCAGLPAGAEVSDGRITGMPDLPGHTDFAFRCIGVAPAAAGSDVVVTAAAADPSGRTLESAATGRVERLDIGIVKTASAQDVPRGTPVTWTIVVSNPGTVVLDAVAVTDAAEPACQQGSLGALPPGATVTLTCSSVMSSGLTNRAIVTSPTASSGGLTVEAVSEAAVGVTGLTLSKTADTDRARVGDVITYTLVVTNTGDVPLNEVAVIDDVVPDCSFSVAVLPAGDSASRDCTVQATVAHAPSLVNTAVALATSPGGDALRAQDEAVVDILLAPSPVATPPVSAPPAATPPSDGLATTGADGAASAAAAGAAAVLLLLGLLLVRRRHRRTS